MNNLDKILREYKDLGLKLSWTSCCGNDDGIIEMIQLVDNRGPNREIVFEITEEQCNVMEFNYDCAMVKQSDKILPTFEEALELASQWR